MLDDVLACEERLVNCWPALDTLLMEGWAVRFANGYSGRANSASAVRVGARMDPALMTEIAGFFRGHGLAPAIRLTPLAEAGLEAQLVAAGWTVASQSIGMIADRPIAGPIHPGLAIIPVPPDGWIAGVSALQEPRKRNPDHLAAILSRIRRPAGFAAIPMDGGIAAFGMTVVDRGMAEIGLIMVDPAWRGRGLGRAVVMGLMQYAAGIGAQRCFLQVEAGNAVARNLYAALGFRDLYTYREYRLPVPVSGA